MTVSFCSTLKLMLLQTTDGESLDSNSSSRGLRATSCSSTEPVSGCLIFIPTTSTLTFSSLLSQPTSLSEYIRVTPRSSDG
uniref:RxLR effector candidate protein n=1 Tax=Hyaloperonospora arabidopsidis (strain Emoy2) TaxID=559515 RepID=A0A090C2Q7_HYAAE|nr:RxLR effector candidate protein [Hyaloperonospora arabidopsidis Emoy2]